MRRGHLLEAQAWLQQSIDLLENALGAEHPEVLPPLCFISEVAERQEDFDRALAHAQRRVRICARAYGASATNTLHARMRVIELRQTLGDQAGALSLFSEFQPEVSKADNGSPNDLRLLMRRVGLFLLRAGQATDALPYLRLNARLAAERQPADSTQRMMRSHALETLVMAYHLADQPEEAKAQYVELAALEAAATESQHQTRFHVLSSLARWFETQDALAALSRMHRFALEQDYSHLLPDIETLMQIDASESRGANEALESIPRTALQ